MSITLKSTLAGKKPVGDSLQIGQLAVNTADQVIYSKHSDNTIKPVSISPKEKGNANGVASLGADGKVPSAQLPAINSSTSFVVNKPTISGSSNLPISVATNYSLSSSSPLSGVTISKFGYSLDSGSVTEVNASSNTATITLNVSGTAGTTKTLEVYAIDSLGNKSDMTDKVLTMVTVSISTPSITSPATGVINIGSSVTITTSAFSSVPTGGTHVSTDWQVATDAGFTNIVFQASSDTTNKVSKTITNPSTNTTYYVRVRYNGTVSGSNASSSYSPTVSYTTASSFGSVMKSSGGQGFGVGPVGDSSKLVNYGISEMSGTKDPLSDNYGNYIHTATNSILVYIPKFYYKYGDTSHAKYSIYGNNTLSIKGIDVYSSTSVANANGYALHRAFIDGGIEIDGFFIDKYLASKDTTYGCKSIKNGNPISLTTNTSYNNSNTFTGCTGILADGVVLARARGNGFNVATLFHYNALAMLSLAHGQSSTSNTYCAWYDSNNVINFPKGCNSNSLADVNDTSVTFTSAYSTKPLTGSASNLAKTTHNGQNNGVTDVNGALWEITIGVTKAGGSATDTAGTVVNGAYVYKESTKHKDLTGGWGTTTDAWGSSTSLANLFDYVSGFEYWSNDGWGYLGNGNNAVFSNSISGKERLMTCAGVPLSTGISSSGTNLMGNDGIYRYNVTNQVPLTGGHWHYSSNTGVFCSDWSNSRSYSNNVVGFRAALAYGS